MVHCSNSVFQLFFWLRTFFLFLQKNLLIRFSFPVFAPLNLYNEVLIFCQSITFLLKLFFSTQKCQKTVTECILWLNPGKKFLPEGGERSNARSNSSSGHTVSCFLESECATRRGHSLRDTAIVFEEFRLVQILFRWVVSQDIIPFDVFRALEKE